MFKYNFLLRVLHWLVGVIIIFMIILGYNMGSLNSGVIANPYGLHKAVGVTVFFLMSVRLLIRIFTKNPELPKASSFTSKALNVFSRVVHFAFYVIIICASISGYIMSSASSRPVKWFFDVDVPLVVDKNPQIASFAKKVHQVLPIVILALLSLHIMGFIKHLVIDKENILKRIV